MADRPADLTAEQLQAILARRNDPSRLIDGGSNGFKQWTTDSSDPYSDYTIDQRAALRNSGGTDGQSYDWSSSTTNIYGPQTGGTWSYQQNPVWDENGKFLGYSGGDSTALGLAKFVAASVASYYAVGATGGESAGLNGLDAAAVDAGAGATNVGAGSVGAGAGGAAPSTVAFDIGSMAPIEWGPTTLGTVPPAGGGGGMLPGLMEKAGEMAVTQAGTKAMQKSGSQPTQQGMFDSPYMGPALVQAGGQLVSGIGQAVAQRDAEKRADKKTAEELARYNANVGTRLWPRKT